MSPKEKQRFNRQYKKHLQALKLQGKAASTIDVYSRAVRRLVARFDRCPDRLTRKQLTQYFSELVDSHSWSTVKTDRNGLQFFWTHVLHKKWRWVDIVKPPQVKTIPAVPCVLNEKLNFGYTEHSAIVMQESIATCSLESSG